MPTSFFAKFLLCVVLCWCLFFFDYCFWNWLVMPTPGWIKLNFDFALSASITIAAAVAWDNLGKVLSWRTISLSSVTIPHVGEAQACLLALNMKLEVFCVEGDAKLVLNSLVDPSRSSIWEVNHIVFDIVTVSSRLYVMVFHSFTFLWIVINWLTCLLGDVIFLLVLFCLFWTSLFQISFYYLICFYVIIFLFNDYII